MLASLASWGGLMPRNSSSFQTFQPKEEEEEEEEEEGEEDSIEFK